MCSNIPGNVYFKTGLSLPEISDHCFPVNGGSTKSKVISPLIVGCIYLVAICTDLHNASVGCSLQAFDTSARLITVK